MRCHKHLKFQSRKKLVRSIGKYPLLCHIILMGIELLWFFWSTEVLFDYIDVVTDSGIDSEIDTDGNDMDADRYKNRLTLCPKIPNPGIYLKDIIRLVRENIWIFIYIRKIKLI